MAKLPCGTVEASISLDHGLITDISFTGDFLFDKPVTELAVLLTGCRYERSAVANRLEQTDVASHFKGATKDDLLDALFLL
jgi:lipoate-protein ligase A